MKRFTTAIQFAGKLTPGEYFDAKTPGLSLRVRESGHRSWTYFYRHNGRLRRWTIGRYEKFKLKDAREKVKQAGDDPAGEKREARMAETFGELAEQFIEKWAKVRNRRWRRSQASLEKYILPEWRHLPLKEITRGDVKALLRQMPGSVFPNRVRALLSKMFAFAVSEDLIDHNPAAGTQPVPETRRDRVLDDDEIRAVWATGNPILRLILATCQRPDDVKGIRRSELNGDTWTIPAERFKTRTTHVIPLTPLVVKLLEAVPQVDDRDRFFTERNGKGLIAVLNEAGVRDTRPKDLQRTARSRLSALGISPDVAERVQGHAIPGIRRTYDTYDYLTEKRHALIRWEKELRRIVQGDSRKVINFR